jgi:hypothetical protein
MARNNSGCVPHGTRGGREIDIACYRRYAVQHLMAQKIQSGFMILWFTLQLRNDLLIMTTPPANDTLAALLKDKTDFAIALDQQSSVSFYRA